MADFYLRPATGFSLSQWLDPARPAGTLGSGDAGAPTRLNPRVGLPHTRWRCEVGTLCSVLAVLDGETDAPVDGELGGRLFSAWWAEWPTDGLVTIFPEAGVTANMEFTPMRAGHHLLAVHRPSGGIVLCHFDAEDP